MSVALGGAAAGMDDVQTSEVPLEPAPEVEEFVPRTGFRLLLLLLILLTGNFFTPAQHQYASFNSVLSLTVLYNTAIIVFYKRLKLRAEPLLIGDLLSVIVLSHFSGGADSPVKYFGLPYLYLTASRLKEGRLLLYILGYTALMALYIPFDHYKSADTETGQMARAAFTNLAIFIGTGWPAVLLSRQIQKERGLQQSASSTFHALNNALHLRTQNLQTALEALTEAHKKLVDVDEKKTRFLSNVSHELRTPLSSIRSFTEIMMSYEDLDRDTQKEFLGIISEESSRLTYLINDILDLVKIESGKVERHLVNVDMSEVITGSLKALEPMARDKGLYITFADPTADLPLVKGDKNQLTQVMVNLLNNAIKFTSKGGITVTAEQDREFIKVAVRDTGEGIFPEEKDVIFEEFYRVGEDVAGRPKGSGLGLTITKKIVEFHCGRIWVESDLGKGSVFYFTVPMDLGILAVPSREKAAEPSPVHVTKREHSVILVLDRNNITRQLLRKRLEKLGYKTLGAESGRTGLNLTEEWNPDLIVSGILNYSNMDVNLHRGIRTNPKTVGTPMLVSCFINDPLHGLQVAVNGFISRPINRFETIKAVESFAPRNKGPLLVVSPDRLEARTIQFILASEGYTVLLAEGSVALEVCRREKPSLIFLDTSLQNERWRDILALVRADALTFQTPVLLITDLSLSEKNVQGVSLGREGFNPDQEIVEPLLKVIRKVLPMESAAVK